MTADEVKDYMYSLRDDNQRTVLMRFFKTGPGEYGEGDQFLGLKVPQTREVARAAKDSLSLDEVRDLIYSPWHEVRLCGFLILVDMFHRKATKRLANNPDAIGERDKLLHFYLDHAHQANNWDLVDLTAPQIVGSWLLLPTKQMEDSPREGRAYKTHILDHLADSPCLWLQRISMVCTLTPIRSGDTSWCLRYAERHLSHPHDLMHKAVGWMLREMGKADIELLRTFLDEHLREMSRTTLRYAIERLPYPERQMWLHR